MGLKVSATLENICLYAALLGRLLLCRPDTRWIGQEAGRTSLGAICRIHLFPPSRGVGVERRLPVGEGCDRLRAAYQGVASGEEGSACARGLSPVAPTGS